VTRKVFFSFHYDDVWKVMQIRNCWTVAGDRETAGFIDKAEFEKVERQGQGAIERWIDRQLDGTSATIVLIGQKTAERPYVQYEIKRSYERGNRLLGIYLDNMKNENGSPISSADRIRLTRSRSRVGFLVPRPSRASCEFLSTTGSWPTGARTFQAGSRPRRGRNHRI
jgi:hypothetical protein